MKDSKTDFFFPFHSAKFHEINQHLILNLLLIRINKITGELYSQSEDKIASSHSLSQFSYIVLVYFFPHK